MPLIKNLVAKFQSKKLISTEARNKISQLRSLQSRYYNKLGSFYECYLLLKIDHFHRKPI